MSLSKSFLIAVVAVGALSITACGKKKEDAKDVGAPLPPQQTPQPPPTGPIKPDNQGQVDRGPVHRGERQGDRNGNGSGSGGSGNSGNAGNHRPKTPAQKNPDVQTTKKVTGAPSNKDGLLYTGAADDDTLAQLQQIEKQLSSDQQDSNFKVAQAVKQVEVFQDISTREASVSVTIEEGSRSEVYNVTGVMIENLSTQVSAINSVQGVRTSGSAKVTGKMQCLDIDVNAKLCSNLLVSLDLKRGRSVSNIKVLVRHSAADLHFDLNESSGNPDFEIFKDFLMSSALDRDTKTKIKTINMQSFEVMNGRSGFDLQIIGGNNEFIGFRGELLAPATGSAVNLPVSITAPRMLRDLSGANHLKLNLMELIRNVRLVMNDGAGKLKLKLSSRARGNYALDVFTLTFTRKANAVIGVNELQ